MIVATKEMKIESGYCPDLSMHMGEVNRQYILTPPFDISGYSVRSEIVKPDHTFVYTDQYINTDGNILFTLPEQAGAVAGYGYYIIKIYDLNTIVYSAVGNLIIDDHLIQDGMIESVAEVNGYTFPDDFVIRGELGNIFDDSTVSNETGWTSTKIKDYVDNYVDNYVNYSTSERVVGKWIDGSTLYEKTVVNSSTLVVGNNLIDIPTDAAFIISATGVFARPLNDVIYSVPLNYYANTTYGTMALDELNGTPHTVRVRIGSDYSSLLASGKVYITIRYTKTTD